MFSNELWQKSGVSTYSIDQSIRFNSSDSTYMQRTHSTGGNTDKWTVSFWIKKGDHSLSASQFVFGSGANTSNTFDLYFESSPVDTLAIQDYAGAYNVQLKTTQVFRDPSAWYHIVYVYDSGNAVSTERARLYVNGQRVTDFGTETYPSQNQDSIVGTNVNIGFGRYISNGSNYFNGYLAEMHYVNGSALDPSSFGEYNSSNIWISKEYSGSYGTGGFFVDGRDSADLGDDESGNGNDLTTSGLASHDQVSDSPTNNFCVMNPNNNSGSGTLSQGNLRYAGASTGNNVAGTIGMSSDKWYWELYIEDDVYLYPGVQDSGVLASGYTEKAVGVETGDNGDIHEDDANSGLDSIDPNTGDIVGIAFDATNKKIWWSLNGVWYRANQSTTAVINVSEVEAGNQGYDLSSRTPDFFMPFIGNYTHGTGIINFGQEGTFAGNTTAGGNSDGNGVGNFKYSVPSGYLALCTKNLGS